MSFIPEILLLNKTIQIELITLKDENKNVFSEKKFLIETHGK